MGENSKIEWTDHTFNPWVGCTKVSPACDHCYAEAWAKRTGAPELWNGARRRTTPANWRKPLAWDLAARAAGTRPRVFCASLADVFDNEVPEAWRVDLFSLIRSTPQLDWLLLTKRIGNAWPMSQHALWGCGMHPGMHHNLPDNVWLGSTVVTQRELRRDVPRLLDMPARVRFLSCEPLLEALDLDEVDQGVDWVICGGESGGHARLMEPAWARSLRDQCRDAGAAFFMKQMTRKEPIPADLLVRQFPTGRE